MIPRLKGLLASTRARVRSVRATGVQLAGCGLVVGGFAMLAPWIGLVIGGVLLAVVGWAIDDVPAGRAGDDE